MLEGKLKFSGHQTFVFRHGWLEKGVQLIQQNTHGFSEDNSLVTLGVGKNMVESIKYWCIQTGLLQEAGRGEMILTELAEFIFGRSCFNEGADPYLEDDGTLWLLHWEMMKNCHPPAPTWSSAQLAFFKWNKSEFTKDELSLAISKWISGAGRVSASTINRDVDCFVRCYAGARGKHAEEAFDSPFLSLELIQGTGQQELYRFNVGTKHNLPAEIVGYAILDYMGNRTNIPVQSCLYDMGSPGQAFKLNESSIMEYLDALSASTGSNLQVSETAGLNSIICKGKRTAAAMAKTLRNQYYQKKRK